MTASLIVRIEVNDFDTWKKEYDGGAEFIKGLGVITESVHRDLDNPNRVTVYHQFADVATGKAFTVVLNGDDFKASAERGGVHLATMKIFLMQDVLPRPGIRTESGTESGTASLIVRHEVKDFDTWMEEMFNSGGEIEKEFGIIAESVHRDLDNPNMVTVYQQFADVATVRAFVDVLNSDRFRVPAKESGILLETMVVIMMADVE